jgi:two-component system copper resistance phosphate regulon response regulator CusR
MTPPNSASTQTTARILLVEDEPKLRDSLVEGLQQEDWSVTPAATGAEAKRRLAVSDFDLVVLDWMLPDADGLEIVRHLRSRGLQMPVLMITARAGAAGKALAVSAGVNAFLTKPFSFDALVSQSRALLTSVA